jgi:hypothetical protein
VSWPLSPRAARVFYNDADAWLGADAAGRDLVAELGPLPEPARRRLERALAWLEWSPRLLLHARRGLSWLPRAERRAWLERLARGGPFRRAVALVRAAVDDCAKPPAPAPGAQSRDGA